MRKYRITAFIAAAAMLSCTAGCDFGGEKYEVVVRNLTGADISELFIYPESGESVYDNRLSENLVSGEEIAIELGSYSEEELQEGFYLQIVNASDGSEGVFNMLFFDSGDKVTFYIDDWGAAVGVNMTDEEVEEQIALEHEIYLESVEEMAEEDATEESTESSEESASE